MCGIAGIVNLDGSPVDSSLLRQMTDAIAHRGPDGSGVWTDGNVGLGHRRLSILDLSDAGAQPMITREGRHVVTFNGEIYNFREERKRLEQRGHQFQSDCDTELLLRLYAEEGDACLQRLRGMFAFGAFDRQTRQLTLVRDRLGQKPLKYFRTEKVFAFASELKALRVHPDCPRDVDWEAVHHFLTMMYLPAPLTGFVGIQKLPAAYVLTLNTTSGVEHCRRYWSLAYEPDHKPTVAEWGERIREELTESVRLRLIADVPVGAFLSGGIDSAAVVATMSRLRDTPVETFSIGSDDPRYDESEQARRMAEYVGTQHHAIPLAADSLHSLSEVVHMYEEPYADPSVLPTYQLAQATRQHVTVALNGDGGDENFAGYVRYPILQFSERYSRLPHSLLRLIAAGATGLASVYGTTFTKRAARFAQTADRPWPERFLQYLSFFSDEDKQRLERSDIQYGRTDAWYAACTKEARQRGGDLLSQALSQDIDTYLADDLLPKVDLGTMAHALEARSPFLDHTFMEMTATIPSSLKLRGRERKWILKQALADMLPAEVLGRKKRGFRVPLHRWFVAEQAFVESAVLERTPRLWEFLDRASTERFLRTALHSRADHSDELWALLWLSEWLYQYADAHA